MISAQTQHAMPYVPDIVYILGYILLVPVYILLNHLYLWGSCFVSRQTIPSLWGRNFVRSVIGIILINTCIKQIMCISGSWWCKFVGKGDFTVKLYTLPVSAYILGYTLPVPVYITGYTLPVPVYIRLYITCTCVYIGLFITCTCIYNVIHYLYQCIYHDIHYLINMSSRAGTIVITSNVFLCDWPADVKPAYDRAQISQHHMSLRNTLI